MLKAHDATITIVESCTGGWVTKMITDITSSSAWFERGFVTYNNEAKARMIGVREKTPIQHSAVSEPVVMEIAIDILEMAHTDYAASISDIAGLDDGSKEKPASTVWFTFTTTHGEDITRRECFSGDHDAVCRQATAYALQTL